MTHSMWLTEIQGLSAKEKKPTNIQTEPARPTLTTREVEVLEHVMLGFTSKAIAQKIGISFRTVETHRSRLMLKMGAKRTSDLVRMAIQASTYRDEPRLGRKR